jgi:hypothetical protein
VQENGTGRRSCEIFSERAKAFLAKAQSREALKENKAIGRWEPLRLCVKLFIFSHLRSACATRHRSAVASISDPCSAVGDRSPLDDIL